MKKRILALVLALASVAGLASTISVTSTTSADPVGSTLKAHGWR